MPPCPIKYPESRPFPQGLGGGEGLHLARGRPNFVPSPYELGRRRSTEFSPLGKETRSTVSRVNLVLCESLYYGTCAHCVCLQV